MKNQKGFGVVEALLILVIAGLVGLAGWHIYSAKRGSSARESLSNQPSARPQATNKISFSGVGLYGLVDSVLGPTYKVFGYAKNSDNVSHTITLKVVFYDDSSKKIAESSLIDVSLNPSEVKFLPKTTTVWSSSFDGKYKFAEIVLVGFDKTININSLKFPNSNLDPKPEFLSKIDIKVTNEKKLYVIEQYYDSTTFDNCYVPSGSICSTFTGEVKNNDSKSHSISFVLDFYSNDKYTDGGIFVESAPITAMIDPNSTANFTSPIVQITRNISVIKAKPYLVDTSAFDTISGSDYFTQSYDLRKTKAH